MAEPVSIPSDGHALDYDIADEVVVSTPQQLKAVADDTRMDIANLLLERAATVSQLADALGKPKGTVGYHVKVLEDAGIIRLVRTGKVRAITEKYYGRAGRTIVFENASKKESHADWFIDDALRGIRAVEGEPLPMFTSRAVRIPVERAVEFSDRINELAQEFLDLPRGGDTVYGFLAGIYPTDRPVLVEEDNDD